MSVLKSVKNYLTGGGAEVVVEILNHVIELDEPIKAIIKVTAKDETLLVKEVYFGVKAEEKSANRHSIFKDQKSVDKNLQLNPGDVKEWEVSLEIPASAPATFIGKHSSLQWYARAGLAVSGVDPKSEWEKFVVNRVTVYAAK